METIHVIKSDGEEVVMGMEALTALYEITGMGWLFKLAKLPVLSGAAEIAYKMVSKNRKSMGGAADGLLALGRINMEEKGEGSCTDLEGECREQAPPVDEEEEAAAAEAEARRAKLAAEKAATAAAAAEAAPAAAHGHEPRGDQQGRAGERRAPARAALLGVAIGSPEHPRRLRQPPLDVERARAARGSRGH